ncbi:MAG: V-type ATP synthase subunit E [Candidatus Micrarchaeota archaeon]|nr:V-type ATP synthase subunit E [Candidatus Micrarchaeota archaeon]
MPLEKLERQITEEGERKARAAEGEGRKQADAIISAAEARAAAIMEAASSEIAREAERMEQEERENVELQERSLMLEARNKAVEKVIPRLRSLTVKRVKKDGYAKLINRAIEEASRLIPQETLTLSISKSDAKLVKEFAGRIKHESVGNGVVIANRSGTMRLTATIEGLFEENRPEIETMLINEAFGRKRSAPAAKTAEKKRVTKKARGKKRGR